MQSLDPIHHACTTSFESFDKLYHLVSHACNRFGTFSSIVIVESFVASTMGLNFGAMVPMMEENIY